MTSDLDAREAALVAREKAVTLREKQVEEREAALLSKTQSEPTSDPTSRPDIETSVSEANAGQTSAPEDLSTAPETETATQGSVPSSIEETQNDHSEGGIAASELPKQEMHVDAAEEKKSGQNDKFIANESIDSADAGISTTEQSKSSETELKPDIKENSADSGKEIEQKGAEAATAEPPVVEDAKPTPSETEPISNLPHDAKDQIKDSEVEEPIVHGSTIEEPKDEGLKDDGSHIDIEEPKVEEPKVEEPKIEEPTVEEPKTEAPTEEPDFEESKVQQPNDAGLKANQTNIDESISESPLTLAPQSEGTTFIPDSGTQSPDANPGVIGSRHTEAPVSNKERKDSVDAHPTSIEVAHDPFKKKVDTTGPIEEIPVRAAPSEASTSDIPQTQPITA